MASTARKLDEVRVDQAAESSTAMAHLEDALEAWETQTGMQLVEPSAPERAEAPTQGGADAWGARPDAHRVSESQAAMMLPADLRAELDEPANSPPPAPKARAPERIATPPRAVQPSRTAGRASTYAPGAPPTLRLVSPPSPAPRPQKMDPTVIAPIAELRPVRVYAAVGAAMLAFAAAVAWLIL